VNTQLALLKGRMNQTSKQQRVLRIVRTVVHRWDPYNVLKIGAPEDEFDREIAAVVKQVPRIQSPNDAAHALSRVFIRVPF
jgi:hypothetical protein